MLSTKHYECALRVEVVQMILVKQREYFRPVDGTKVVVRLTSGRAVVVNVGQYI